MGLDTVELVMRFEEEFGVEIPDKAAEKMETPNDVGNFLVAELNRRGRPTDPAQILQRVRELTAEQSGLDLAKITPNSRFVADLGLD